MRDRETIPPVLKTIPSSSLAVGVRVQCVFLPGNDTAAWGEQERQLQWNKAHEGVLYPGVVTAKISFLQRFTLRSYPDLLQILESFTVRRGAGELTANATNFVNEEPVLGV